MTSMMLLTCAMALREFQLLFFLSARSLTVVVSWYYLVSNHEDVRSDRESTDPCGSLGCFSTRGFTRVLVCKLTNCWMPDRFSSN